MLPEALPEAWQDGEANGLGILLALSNRAGRSLPWVVVRDALDGAITARMLERAADSGPWPCEFDGARNVKFRVPKAPPPPPPPKKTGVRTAGAELSVGQIQDLAEAVGDIAKAAVGYGIVFRMNVELGGEKAAPEEVVGRIDDLLRGISDELELK